MIVYFKQRIRNGGKVKIITVPKKKLIEGDLKEGDEVIVSVSRTKR